MNERLLTTRRQVILQCRIHALYSSRRLAVFNAICFLLEIGGMVVLYLYNPAVCKCAVSDRSDSSHIMRTGKATCGGLMPLYWIPGVRPSLHKVSSADDPK